jgi:hypothetical protein
MNICEQGAGAVLTLIGSRDESGHERGDHSAISSRQGTHAQYAFFGCPRGTNQTSEVRSRMSEFPDQCAGQRALGR